MQTMEAIAKRKLTRDFDPGKPVSDEVVDAILKAGCQAPIAGKPGESLHLTVCRDRGIIDEINKLAGDGLLRLHTMKTAVDATKIERYSKYIAEFYDDQVGGAATVILSRTQNLSEEERIQHQTITMTMRMNAVNMNMSPSRG